MDIFYIHLDGLPSAHTDVVASNLMDTLYNAVIHVCNKNVARSRTYNEAGLFLLVMNYLLCFKILN